MPTVHRFKMVAGKDNAGNEILTFHTMPPFGKESKVIGGTTKKGNKYEVGGNEFKDFQGALMFIVRRFLGVRRPLDRFNIDGQGVVTIREKD